MYLGTVCGCRTLRQELKVNKRGEDGSFEVVKVHSENGEQ